MLRRVFVGMLLTVTALLFAPGVAAAEESWKLVGGPTEVSRTQPSCLLCPTDRPPSWELTGGPGALTSTVTDTMLELTTSVSIGWTVPNVLIPFDDLGSLASPGPNDGYLVIDAVIGFAGGAAPPTGEYSVAEISAFLLVRQEAPPPGLYGTAAGAILHADGSVAASGPHDVQVPSYWAGTGSGTYSTKMWLQVTVKHWGAEIIYQYEYDWVAAPPTPTPFASPTVSRTPGESPWPWPGLEDSGVSFSDLAGQVGYLVPEPDGTYDEENWNSPTSRQFYGGQTFPVGTKIRTEEKSEAILGFPDMTVFHMKPQTTIILSSTAAHDSQIELVWGNLWVNVKKMFKDGSMEIEASQAVAGIKGTIFIISDDLISTTLQVIEGSVVFTANDGSQATVATGQQATATADQGVGATTPFDVNTALGYGTIDHAALGLPVIATGPPDASAPAAAEAGGSTILLGILVVIALALVALIGVALITLALQMRRRLS